MVKFSKELEAQLISEWKDAFVNYRMLKKHVKRIKVAKSSRHTPHQQECNIGYSILDPIRTMATKISDRLCNSAHNAPEIIEVRSKTKVQEDETQDQEVYETELSHLFSDEDEIRQYFATLDDELNKVNQFYRSKETEFIERGELLKNQLQVLVDLKQVLDDRRRKKLSSKSGSGFFSRSLSFSSRNSDYSDSGTDCTESPAEANSTNETDEVIASLERNGLNFINSASTRSKKGTKVAMRIDNQVTNASGNPTLWDDLVKNPKKEGHGESVNSHKIQRAAKMIRGAFVELYKGLGLLKKYSSLNMVAFTKILKKFDKVSNQEASASYLKVVKGSHFISSDKVVRLMDEVESLFTQHFANNDRKQAMKFLRPQQQAESHMVSFFVGLFTGCFITLFCVYGILAHISGMFSPTTGVAYVETVYPVFSMFALLSLHLFMYGCNLFMWNGTRINYKFIFELDPNTALTYRDAFLICTCMMTAVVGAMVVHLILLSNGFSPAKADTVPGILLVCFIALLICPLNIFYRPTRYFFLRVIRNIVFSPFYKVLLVDFFMADQLTSQIPLMRHVESTVCYFSAGSFKTHQYSTCKSGKMYRELAYVISFAPYYWRAMQCARRWFDDADVTHLANLGKYVSAMVAAGARLTYARQPTTLWMIIVLVTSLIATVYQLYWDFVKDWGFFNPKSRNPWLRDELILKNKSIYYISIVLNFFLRIAWVETVMKFNVGILESRLLDFFLASLEVIRRGHWNFYRLENEHLNNAGNYRAVKDPPVPFDTHFNA